MIQYCSDFYGSVLWDLNHPSVVELSIAWRKGLRRATGLPYNTHSAYIAPLCELLPLRIELACRSVRFIVKCLYSENYVVSAVARNGVYSSRAQSSVGRNAQFCCSLFKVPLHKLCAVNKQLGFSVANNCISDDCLYIINMIRELLCVKHQQLELSSSFLTARTLIA